MAEKTITELKKLCLVISNQYQEYREVVGQLKQVLNDRGKTIMNNKLEIFTLKKDGYSGPPEDEKFFKICQAMQRKLLKRHTETYYKDFKYFEKSIEKKFRMMDTELHHLQRISILWDEKQDPIENMSKIIKRKEMEITALKQEMYQLFKQKEQDRMQISTLEQESKPANEKILLLKRAYEKERSIRRQILEQLRQAKGECKELDGKLKILLEETNGLHEKYQKENTLHKITKDNVKRLQGQLQQMVQEKNCLQSRYEKEKMKCKQTKESLDKTIDELQVQVKETVKEHKCIGKNYEKEKSAHKSTKEALDQTIEELRGQLEEALQEHQCLKNTYEKETSAHKSTKEALDQTIEELQGQLEEALQEHQCLKNTYEKEKSAHKSAKEALNQVIEELQGQLKQAAQDNEDLEERFQKEISISRSTRAELVQTMKELDRVCSENQVRTTNEVQLQNTMIENKALEEIYRQEMIDNKNKREELEQSVEKLQLQLQQADEQHKVMCKRTKQFQVKLQQREEKKDSSEEKYRMEVDAHALTRDQLGQDIQELQGKLKQEKDKNLLLEENYESEKSSHINTQEELAQASHQNQEKSAKLEELQLQLLQAVEEQKNTKENHRREMSAHKHTKKQLNRLEELYEKEKSERKQAKEELEQCMEKAKERHVKVQQADEANIAFEEICQMETSDSRRVTDKAEKPSVEKHKCPEINCKHERSAHKSTRKELEQVRNQNRVMNDKLLQVELQLQQALEEKQYVQENRVTEMSGLQLQLQQVLEEMDQARCQNQIMEAKLQEIQQLRGSGKNYQELHIRTRDRQFLQDLQACLSVMCDTKSLKQRLIAMKRRYIDNEQGQRGETVEQEEEQLGHRDLSKRLRGCENLLKVKSDTISRLEQKISAIVQLCAKRERKYVQILNNHIVKEHRLTKELEKASKPIPQKVSSWWHEKVLKNTLETPQEEEEQISLYPEDWRLPDFPEYHQLLDS